MTVSNDVETLKTWVLLCLMVAAVCTTAFPILWSFSRWWSTILGRLFMLQAIVFAVAVDFILYFQFYPSALERLEMVLWIEAVVFGLMSLSTMLLTGAMIRLNYMRHNQKKEQAQNGD